MYTYIYTWHGFSLVGTRNAFERIATRRNIAYLAYIIEGARCRNSRSWKSKKNKKEEEKGTYIYTTSGMFGISRFIPRKLSKYRKKSQLNLFICYLFSFPFFFYFTNIFFDSNSKLRIQKRNIIGYIPYFLIDLL